MRTVILGISSREKTNKRLLGALEGKPQETFISSKSPALLFKILSGNRWELLKVMTNAGPISMSEASRRLGRDIKAVHREDKLFALTAIPDVKRLEDILISIQIAGNLCNIIL